MVLQSLLQSLAITRLKQPKMSFQVQLIPPSGKRIYQSVDGYGHDVELLCVTTTPAIDGLWKNTTHTGSTTTQLIVPPARHAIAVTDYKVGCGKKVSHTVTLQFTDGTQIETFSDDLATDGPVSVVNNLTGQLRGWRDARVDFVTDTVEPTTVVVHYIFIGPEVADDFAVWDARRKGVIFG